MTFDEFMHKYYREQPKQAIKAAMGSLVKKTRVGAGLTQNELAKKMGTKQESIARAESGAMEPSIYFLYRVADACGKKLKVPRIV